MRHSSLGVRGHGGDVVVGRQAAELGLKVMAGETLPETEILLETELVTRDNAAGWTPWATE